MDVLCEVRDTVGESPLWSVEEQALYWVDIEGRAIRRFEWATQRVQSWACAERVGCIALHGDGGLLAAMETGIFHLRLYDSGEVSPSRLATVAHGREGMRFNDGRCDRAGRFWAGTMVRDMSLADPAGVLMRLDGGLDGTGTPSLRGPFVDGLITPNGLGFSPDGHTMYLSDSHPRSQMVWAFDLDADGTPTRRREFVDMKLHPGRPDGAAVDAEGAYWICANDAGLVHRFLPDGRLERSLRVPVAKPSMCAFGGPQLDWLFITSIRPAGPAGDASAEASLPGAVFITRTGVAGLAGLPETPFGA